MSGGGKRNPHPSTHEATRRKGVCSFLPLHSGGWCRLESCSYETLPMAKGRPMENKIRGCRCFAGWGTGCFCSFPALGRVLKPRAASFSNGKQHPTGQALGALEASLVQGGGVLCSLLHKVNTHKAFKICVPF